MVRNYFFYSYLFYSTQNYRIYNVYYHECKNYPVNFSFNKSFLKEHRYIINWSRIVEIYNSLLPASARLKRFLPRLKNLHADTVNKFRIIINCETRLEMLKKTIRKVYCKYSNKRIRASSIRKFTLKKKKEREINTIFPSKVNLTNRQLLEFARLVAGKIARLPTRRAVPSISKTGTEIRRFLSFPFCFV